MRVKPRCIYCGRPKSGSSRACRGHSDLPSKDPNLLVCRRSLRPEELR